MDPRQQFLPRKRIRIRLTSLRERLHCLLLRLLQDRQLSLFLQPYELLGGAHVGYLHFRDPHAIGRDIGVDGRYKVVGHCTCEAEWPPRQ